MSQVRTILRRATHKDKYNILCFPTHERYDPVIAKTGHNFYGYITPGGKGWDTRMSPIPDNYTLLNRNRGNLQIPAWVDIDMVLSQNRMSQYPKAVEISMRLGVPLITLEHTLPTANTHESIKKHFVECQGDIDVFVTPNNREAWGFPSDHGEICPIGIDTDFFQRQDWIDRDSNHAILTVANDFIGRDELLGYRLWAQTVGHPNNPQLPYWVVGNTKGLSEPAQSIDEMLTIYNKSCIYLNTTLVSSLPTVIIEAMACEIPIVTTGTTLIPKLMVKHGVTGFVSEKNDPAELRHYCQLLLSKPELRQEMGKRGREWVLENFNEKTCITKWNEIFEKASRFHR